jgi:2'-5' RNA ligase
MAETLRTFVSVPITDTVALFLRQIQRQLQLLVANMRWVAPENIHLTLKFLGDIETSQVHAVVEQMDKAAASFAPFWLNAQGVGVFPNFRNARILWVGLAGDCNRLGAIHATLESGLESVGFRRASRGFRAHLTIGRTRRRVAPQTLETSLNPLTGAASEAFRVDRLVLYKSTLKPSGAEYTRLHTSRLAE